DRPSWHYVDFPFFADGERPVKFNLSTEFPTAIDAKDYNVSQATKNCLAILKQSDSTSERGLAYSWLFHLVGDLHQPLHSTALVCDHFPEGDKGGNAVAVVQGHNLHSLWDGLLGTRAQMNDVDREMRKLKEQPKLWDVDTKTTVDDWIAESHQIAT